MTSTRWLALAAAALGSAALLRAAPAPSPAPATPAAVAREAAPATGTTVPRFVEVGERAGARFLHHTRAFHGPYSDVLEMFTNGGAAVAVGDYDGDGRDDLFLTDSAEGAQSHLLHNEGPAADGSPRFRDVTAGSGVGGGNDADSIVSDALFFDADGDGREDLVVTRFGKPLLYRNLGGGRFRDETAGSGLDAFADTIAVIAFDYDRDGKLDLLFGNYFAPVNLLTGKQRTVLPDNLDQATNGGGVTLWHNLGAGGKAWLRFADVTAAAGLAGQHGWTLDVGHADLDDDGWDDLYLACDWGTDRIFWNQRDGTFADGTAAAIGIDTRKGMNVDVADYDRDGRLDIYVTNITDDYMKECNMLWHNEGIPDPKARESRETGQGQGGRPTFTDLSRETGTCNTLWGWGAKFADLDDDGWPDLFAADGLRSAGPGDYIPEVVEMIVRPGVDFRDLAVWPPIGNRSWSGHQRKKLFHNHGGSAFAEVAAAAGVDNDLDGRGVAVADFDGDGRLDMVQTNARQESLLYWNRTPTANHWVTLHLIGSNGNTDAIGARVELKAGGLTQVAEVDGGNGYAGSSTRALHFGLGAASAVDALEIRWPDGRVEKASVPVDHTTTLREKGGAPR
jgi:ASPIC/UnbV protein/VCBS repeat protein